MDYVLSDRIKKITLGTSAIGLVLFLLAAFLDNADYGTMHHGLNQRIWSSVLINGFFFFAISLSMLFFLTLQYASEASWTIVFKRIFEAMISVLPYMAMVVVIVLAAGHFFHWHHLYHWMDAEAVAHDHLLSHKAPYFGKAFYWARQIFFIGSFLAFGAYFRKRSLREDQEGGVKIHKKNITMSAIFLVIFGYGSSVIAWDWIMSIDAHWFSTLFGWYVFAGMWLTGIVFATVLIYFLRSNGHLQIAKKGHMHDMAKWMFALSFLWTYLFFSQFMLIWYANIPEEVTYYVARIQDYKLVWFGMMLVNFALPMIFLMDADAKMKKGLVVTIGAIIFLFHWFDVYTMVTPGTMKQYGHFGFLEVGMFMFFLGGFVFLVLKSLASRPLVVKNHPYLEESKHIHG